MVSLLSGILGGVGLMGQFVLWGLVAFANLVIVAIGALIATLFGLLPSMPAAPDRPVASWIGWLNWLFPVSELVSGLVVFVTLWTSFLVIRMGLRWVKAL